MVSFVCSNDSDSFVLELGGTLGVGWNSTSWSWVKLNEVGWDPRSWVEPKELGGILFVFLCSSSSSLFVLCFSSSFSSSLFLPFFSCIAVGCLYSSRVLVYIAVGRFEPVRRFEVRARIC